MSKIIQKLDNFIKENNINIFQISVYENGKIESIDYKKVSRIQNIYSIAKLYTVHAIGLLVDNKKLSLNDKLLDILNDSIPNDIDNKWYDVTIDMLLSHKIGLEHSFLDTDLTDVAQKNKDFLIYSLTQPLNDKHGKERVYTDCSHYLLSLVVEKIAKKPLDVFLYDNLFYDLKYKEVAWSKCPMGHPLGATGLYLSAEDVVKLGIIYLNDGTFEGKRYVGNGFVKTVKERGYELRKDIENADIFIKGGMNGQCLILDESKNVTISWLGFGEHNEKVIDFLTKI